MLIENPVLENDKQFFSENHILSLLRPACCENLTWQNLTCRNLKVLAELANLTVMARIPKERAIYGLLLILTPKFFSTFI